MKKIGIIGGLSPESTLKYYQWLNEGVREKLGGHHSARIILSSLDFQTFVTLKSQGDWTTQGRLLAAEAKTLEAAGADAILLATNTMHKIAGTVEQAISIPLLHIADATANRVVQSGIGKIGLLGTRFTMAEDFYVSRLTAHGLTPLVPPPEDQEIVNAIIYDELCRGISSTAARQEFRRIMAGLAENGAEGIIMGCTEITLLIEQTDAPVPLFDTMKIHVERAIDFIFGDPAQAIS